MKFFLLFVSPHRLVVGFSSKLLELHHPSRLVTIPENEMIRCVKMR
jgi:hypothetical protein